MERDIRNTISEQAAGGKEVLKALTEMNEMTAQVKGAAGEMQAGSSQVAGELRGLLSATEAVRERMERIVSDIAEVDDATKGVMRFAEENGHAAGEVSREVSRFRIREAPPKSA
jgi:methyl-accepting chemotaxis protein